MKIDSVKATVVTTTLLASSLATAGAPMQTPPVEAPVMGPWALGMMAALIAAVAYRIKKK